MKNTYRILGEFTEIDLKNKNKEVVGVVTINTGDLEIISEFTWSLTTAGYAWSTACNRRYQMGYMHRFIAKCKDGRIVDHINRNTLDNTKANLRITNKMVNAINSNGQKGIHWYKAYEKWQAYIDVNKKRIFLGYFDTYEEALKERKFAEELYHEPVLKEVQHV